MIKKLMSGDFFPDPTFIRFWKMLKKKKSKNDCNA